VLAHTAEESVDLTELEASADAYVTLANGLPAEDA